MENKQRHYMSSSLSSSTSSVTSSDDEDGGEQKSKHVLLPISRTTSTATLKNQSTINVSQPALIESPVICSCNKNCIHLVTQSGNYKKLNSFLLVNNAGELLCRDEYGKTCLHWAASIGNHIKALNCIRILLDKYISFYKTEEDPSLLEAFVNIQDYNKATALYLAAKYENKEVCETLIKAYTDVTLRSKSGKTALEMIYKHIPEALLFTLDLAMEKCGYIDETKTQLQLYTTTITGEITTENGPAMEMAMIANILHSPIKSRAKFLNHLLVKIFLRIQWNKYHLLFWIIRILRLFWLFIYFTIMVHVFREKCPYYGKNPEANSNSTLIPLDFSWFSLIPITNRAENFSARAGLVQWKGLQQCDINLVARFVTMGLTFVTIFIMILELTFAINSIRRKPKKRIILDKLRIIKKIKRRHFLKISLLVITFLTCFYTSFCIGEVPTLNLIGIIPNDHLYVLAAVGVFLAWIHIFLEVGKIPKFRIHIEMFTTVLKPFGNVMLTYLSILVAFAMVFCILLPGFPAYTSLPQSVLYLVAFMAGDPNYHSTFYDNESEIMLQNSPSLVFSMLFYVIAIAIITIVMLNYLIGLTVCDIQTLMEEAQVWELSTVISQIKLLEAIPKKITKYAVITKFMTLLDLIFPKRKVGNQTHSLHVIDLRDLPKDIRNDIRNWNLKRLTR